MTEQQQPQPQPQPVFLSEYCWFGDWDSFRVRSIKPVPNFIVRFFSKLLLGIHYRKFIGV